MAEDVTFQRGGEPAAAAQGGFGGWVKEKPWHFWVTVIIGLLGVYLAYKAFQNYQANNSSSSGSVLGSSGSVLDPGASAGTTTSTTALDTGATTGSSSGTSTPTAAAPFWSSLLGANPLSTAADPHYFTVGESGAPGLNTFASIAQAFHIPAVNSLTDNPNNASLKGYGANQQLPQGTQVWVTTSQINPNAPNHLG